MLGKNKLQNTIWGNLLLYNITKVILTEIYFMQGANRKYDIAQ